ncbi:hypothetical protein CBW65_22660 [Tumebacillus avium]|uniref:Uncharacterized protein n=1 Tax=Tumebacillus avium TaxID=1903704 RepID=A0A1Y0IT71_9BACL|nr:hypothetical protein [Tumebacillus avium]ARU63490.1 hypothetical protein CBW65_22660 [Tumebacillus avium]
MSKRHRHAVLTGPVITTPPGAVPPVIIANPHLVAQPLQFPLQPSAYPTYYEVPYPDHFIQNPAELYNHPHPTDIYQSPDAQAQLRLTGSARFFPAPIPPLFPPVYGPFPPLFPPVPPPFYPYPAPPVVFPIIF